MIRSRVLGMVSVVGLLPGPVLAGATPARAEEPAKQAQAVTFSTTPPSGQDWFYGNIGGGPWDAGYVANASATSGLPVTFAVAPESVDVCRIVVEFDDTYSAPFAGGVGVQFLAPGTCTLYADQPGDDQYLPAERASQSFEIEKAPSWLSAVKGVKNLLGPSTFTATLSIPERLSHLMTGARGYPGQTVTFSVSGKIACSATTNADGVATCTAALGLLTVLAQTQFTAGYAGDDRYKSVSATRMFSLL